MAYRPHGRAEVNPDDPRAWGRCDRCFGLVNHDTLQWQMRFAGPQLVNTRKFVCPNCLDIPNMQEHTIVLPPDPVPIRNARPSDNSVETDYIVTDDGFFIEDDLGDDLVTGGNNV